MSSDLIYVAAETMEVTSDHQSLSLFYSLIHCGPFAWQLDAYIFCKPGAFQEELIQKNQIRLYLTDSYILTLSCMEH